MSTLSKKSELGLTQLINLDLLVHREGFQLRFSSDLSCHFVLDPLVRFLILRVLVFFYKLQFLKRINLFFDSVVLRSWQGSEFLGVFGLEQCSVERAFRVPLSVLPSEQVFSLFPINKGEGSILLLTLAAGVQRTWLLVPLCGALASRDCIFE